MFLPSQTHGINYFLSGHSSLVHTLSYPISQISHLCVPLQDGIYNWASLMSQMVKKLPANAEGTRDVEFSPWAGKILWRRKWQPTPVFLSGKFHGQRSLVGYSPWGSQSRMIQAYYIYCALYFYHYFFSSTSDHQALDPRGWGLLDLKDWTTQSTHCSFEAIYWDKECLTMGHVYRVLSRAVYTV